MTIEISDSTATLSLDVYYALLDALGSRKILTLPDELNETLKMRYGTLQAASLALNVKLSDIQHVTGKRKQPARALTTVLANKLPTEAYGVCLPDNRTKSAQPELINWTVLFELIKEQSPKEAASIRKLLVGYSPKKRLAGAYLIKPARLYQIARLLNVTVESLLLVKPPLANNEGMVILRDFYGRRDSKVITELIRSLGTTPHAFCKRLGTTPYVLNQWMLGKTKPGLRSLISLCKVLNVRFDYWQSWLDLPVGK